MVTKEVCFITPPSPFLLDERVFPALGILKVAACAERLGYKVEHLDLNGVSNPGEVVCRYCEKTTTRIFGLTATTPQMVSVMKIRNGLKRLIPQARLILGGPHPTLVHAATKYSPRAKNALTELKQKFDVIVAGDGEESIGIALQEKPPSMIDADNPSTSLFLKSHELATIPFPARHLVDLQSYHYQIDGVNVTPLIGQLGCPFGCNFCAGRDSAMLRRVRLRPTSNIIAEMRHLYHAYGIHGFMFFDDELNVNPKVTELLREMDRLQQELGVEFRCRGFVKSELFTEEQAQLMYKAGFRRIMCGFESGSNRILKNINKNATKDDNTRTMEISHKYGLDMKALMSVGHPGENDQTLEDTRQWLLSVKPADFDCTIITAYPGSPYYDRAINVFSDTWAFETNGDFLYMRDIDYTKIEDFYKGSLEGYKSYVWTDMLDPEDIVSTRDYIERTVRKELNIPFYQATAATRIEASMGQLPGSIYRES